MRLRIPRTTQRREQFARREDLSGELQGEPGESQSAEPADDAKARGDFCCQEDRVPKAGQKRAGAEPRGSQTCVCANTLPRRWHAQGRRANSRPAVVPSGQHDQVPPVRRTKRREDRAAWKHVSGRHVVRGRQSSPFPVLNSCSFSAAVGGAPG